MNILSNFAETLNELMIVREVSPKQLAEKISINEKTVYAWKQNANFPSLSNLIALSDFFKVRLDFLAGRSDSEQPYTNKECHPFAKRLREIMKEKRISTYYLRKHTRYGSSFFARWDRGADPLLPTLIELASIFDCTIDYLVGREE